MTNLLRSASLAIALTTSACGASQSQSPPTTAPRTIVLVHGAFADHHAFDGVRPLLEARGFRVLTPDLPGHGEQAAAGPLDLAAYVTAVKSVVDAERGEVVLVGHSMAGMVVAQVAEQAPAKISQLVFVAAYLPRTGDTLQKLAETDAASEVGRNMVFAPDYTTVTIKPDKIVGAICADVPKAVQDIIVASQKPEPLAPFQSAVSLTAEKFGRVKKAYLRTSNDRAVTPALQGRMLAAYPDIAAETIDTSHLPFVARPQEFVTKLEALITQAR